MGAMAGKARTSAGVIRFAAEDSQSLPVPRQERIDRVQSGDLVWMGLMSGSIRPVGAAMM